MRVLITGSNGLLGQKLVAYALNRTLIFGGFLPGKTVTQPVRPKSTQLLTLPILARCNIS